MTVGRLATIEKNSVDLIGVRTMNVSWAGGSINLTSGENSGIQVLDSVAAEEALTITIEGIAKDAVIRALVLGASTRLFTDMQINYANGDTLAVDLFMSAFDEGKPYNDAITFSATFESSGTWVYTPAV